MAHSESVNKIVGRKIHKPLSNIFASLSISPKLRQVALRSAISPQGRQKCSSPGKGHRQLGGRQSKSTGEGLSGSGNSTTGEGSGAVIGVVVGGAVVGVVVSLNKVDRVGGVAEQSSAFSSLLSAQSKFPSHSSRWKKQR